jgi:hypothetical protein
VRAFDIHVERPCLLVIDVILRGVELAGRMVDAAHAAQTHRALRRLGLLPILR